MLTLIFLLALVAILVYFLTPRQVVISHWNHYYDGTQFSIQELYTQISNGIEMRNPPSVRVSRVNRPEKNFLLSQREYIRIQCQELFIEIGAAHYGTGSFVSWWLSTSVSYWEGKAAQSNSKFSALIAATFEKTRYQMDKADAFKSCIHTVVTEVLKNIETTKGVRGTAELELNPVSMNDLQ